MHQKRFSHFRPSDLKIAAITPDVWTLYGFPSFELKVGSGQMDGM